MPLPRSLLQRAKALYSQPYPGSEDVSKEGIARLMHGMQHVSRAAFYSQLWANLYRSNGVELSDEDVEHIQIATILHDSARQGEETDYWDNESAINIYHYMVDELKVDSDRAKLIAESMANKDAKAGDKFLVLNTNTMAFDEASYDAAKQASHGKFIDCIHDADCLDIIRARDHFDLKYLNFYHNQVVKPEGIDRNNLELMSQVVTQARGLIAKQGDKRGSLDFELKKQFELAEDPYQQTCQCVADDPKLFALAYLADSTLTNDQTPAELQQSLDAKSQALYANLPPEIREGLLQKRLFLRGITKPKSLLIGLKIKLSLLQSSN